MIKTFLEMLELYKEDLATLTRQEFEELGDLSDRTRLINEKIKISNMFSRYIIERCKPSEVNPLRRLVEEYEYKVGLYKDGLAEEDDFSDLKDMTAFIDILFGMDTPYYDSVYEIVNSEDLEKLIDCVANKDYNYETILSYIGRRKNNGRGKW